MKIKLSLQTKIFSIFLATMILVIISILFFTQDLRRTRKSSIISVRKNLIIHLHSQIDKIGFPPNFEIAGEIAKELDLKIVISGKGLTWRSDPTFGSLELLKPEMDLEPYKDFEFGRFKGHLFAFTRQNGYTYSFEFLANEIFVIPYRKIIGLGIMIILILVASLIVTRWVMKPVRPLVEGVKELSKGNFNFRIQFHQNDEFGFFADIFNHMAQQIQQMLQAKDKLLLDVSHELRSPLGRMKVASEMVKENLLQSSLREDIHEMEFMIDEILERYRLNTPQGALKLERINLAAHLEELTGLYNKTSRVGVLFQNRLSGEAWIQGDVNRLKKAFTNVIENGIKFSVSSSSPVEITLSSDSLHYVIEVTDHGVGMKDSELRLIFEPFYKNDPSREKRFGGYGLGLSICKDIINAHSGKISVSSQKNLYTQFIISLPKL